MGDIFQTVIIIFGDILRRGLEIINKKTGSFTCREKLTL
jgi:hypothetical protein